MKSLICCLVFLALCANSHAGLIMSFTADGSPQPLTVINVGQPTTLDVYLLQTVNEFSSPPYNAGLVSGGVRLNFGPEVQVTAFTHDNPPWDFSSLALGAGYADLATGILVLPVFPGPPFFPADAIRLGTVSLVGVTPGLATVTFSDNGTDMFVLDDVPGTVIDGVIDFASNNGPIQVQGAAAIPEPGSVGLSLLVLGVASAVTGYRTRRRGKKLTSDPIGQ